MTKITVVTMICSLVAGGFLTNPSVARAAGTRKFHPSTCIVKTGPQLGTPTFNSAGQIGNLTDLPVVLWCPLISDPTVGLPGTGPVGSCPA